MYKNGVPLPLLSLLFAQFPSHDGAVCVCVILCRRKQKRLCPMALCPQLHVLAVLYICTDVGARSLRFVRDGCPQPPRVHRTKTFGVSLSRSPDPQKPTSDCFGQFRQYRGGVVHGYINLRLDFHVLLPTLSICCKSFRVPKHFCLSPDHAHASYVARRNPPPC